jgi:ribosomal protein S18 acetylase RimI-like enzyme
VVLHDYQRRVFDVADRITIRNAEPRDAEAIDGIRVAAWKAAYSCFLPSDYLQSLSAGGDLSGLRDRLRDPDDSFSAYVALSDQQVCAFSFMGNPRYETDSGAIELYALNVLPSCWRWGLGGKLLAECLREAKKNSFERMELWCIRENDRAIKFYKSFGFSDTGRERDNRHLTGHSLFEQCFCLPLQS